MEWILIKDYKHQAQERLYLVCENKNGFRYQTIAEYIPYMAVKESDYMAEEFQGDGDYNDDEDEYYTPEGWYEWQGEPDINWKISVKVTHFMRQHDLPNRV
jgi:hypothetical protein